MQRLASHVRERHQGRSSPILGGLIERVAAMDAALARPFADAAGAALSWWVIHRELLIELEFVRSPASDKPYVGLHTPDTDPVVVVEEGDAPHQGNG